jgi:hypothetical protein
MPVANSKAMFKTLVSIETEVQKWEQEAQLCIKSLNNCEKKYNQEKQKAKNKKEYYDLEQSRRYFYNSICRTLKNIQTELTSAQKKESWLRLVLTGSRLKPEDR